jgi:hypothetical protein
MSARRLAKYFALTLCLLPALYLVAFNVRQYYRPAFARTAHGTYHADLYRQLQYLKTKMHRGAGDAQQDLYPEGLVFSHAVYGLAWANLAAGLDTASPLRREALDEMHWALTRVRTSRARQNFPEDLPLRYGAFYQGWTTYLLARFVDLGGSDHRTWEAQLDTACAAIARAFEASPGQYIASYNYGTWPADNLVCLAALARRDRPLAQRLLHQLPQVNGSGDLPSLPHAVEPGEDSRGSSMSLMLVFLPEIDTAFAQRQGRLYLDRFVDRRFGLPGIREYPFPTVGYGDVDSGPVVLGMGGAASIVGIAALERLGERQLSRQLRNAVEAISFPVTWSGKKRYFAGQVLMADLFLAWVQSFQTVPDIDNASVPWRFHGVSALLLVMVYGFYRFLVFLAERGGGD